MPQVVLIPTGKLEHAALAPALSQLFPGATFITRPKSGHLDGFTSVDVTRLAPPPRPVPSALDELAAELVAAVAPGPRGSPADYAYAVDDLELVNNHQPAEVVGEFRDAVDLHIRTRWANQHFETVVRDRVRERCSFHLFRPMTEAYFFGERDAVSRAGAVQTALLPANLDLEEFRTSDQIYLQLPSDKRPKKERRVVDMPDRERHPKSYVQYLCDPTLSDRRTQYRESRGGVAALGTLNWEQVVSGPPHCPFLHAFLDDLAEALNHRPTCVDAGHASALTKINGAQNRLLRNV